MQAASGAAVRARGAPPPADGGFVQLECELPPGVLPGQSFPVQYGVGRFVWVQCPEEAQAGQTIRVAGASLRVLRCCID